MTAPTKDTFRISRAPLSGTYRISPENITTSSNYSLDVKPRTNAERPFMVLHDDSQKRICGLVRRPINSSVFEIRVGGYDNTSSKENDTDHGDEWHDLSCPSNSTALWSICLPSGETRTFAWVRSSLSLAGRGMKLVDVTGMGQASAESLKDTAALASFERKKGVMSFGKIEVNRAASSYGDSFTQLLMLTAMCLNDQTSKRGTNALGWGSSGFEDPVAGDPYK